MNYEKMGKFIASKRKELGLTQKDLADTLKITDRAVSRWERGLGCPDISLLEDLANILNVSLLEILHGEEITEQEEENQVIVKILNKNSKMLRIWKNMTLFFLNLFLVLAILSFFFLFLFPAKIEKNPNKAMYPIVSGSMSPNLKPYDVVIIEKKDIKEIQIGDIIAYVSNAKISNGMTLIHRVTNKTSDEETGEVYLQTKGDNNSQKDDGIVTNENFIGVMEKRIPLLGRFLPIQVFPRRLVVFNILIIWSILVLDFIQLRNRKKKLW